MLVFGGVYWCSVLLTHKLTGNPTSEQKTNTNCGYPILPLKFTEPRMTTMSQKLDTFCQSSIFRCSFMSVLILCNGSSNVFWCLMLIFTWLLAKSSKHILPNGGEKWWWIPWDPNLKKKDQLNKSKLEYFTYVYHENEPFMYPKDPKPSKLAMLRTKNPYSTGSFTLPLEGQMILRVGKYIQSEKKVTE